MLDYGEEARLDALYQLRLLDTPASESFDRITRLASQIFQLPVAAVSLTDRDRQWFKSRVGADHSSIPRHKAPCAEVATSTAPLIIEDLLLHPVYADSTLGLAGTRFYAGVPLVTWDGYGLGSLCVLGTTPRQASPSEMAALTDLAAIVMAQIELQHAFGRIDPVSGLPTRSQFRDDLGDLARDCPDQQRLAVVVDLARDDQVSRITRALGGGRVEELIREACRWLQNAIGQSRSVYHVGAVQFAFLAPEGVEPAAYLKDMQSAFRSMSDASSMRFVTNVAIGMRPFALGQVSADNVLRGAASAAQDARRTDGSVALYSSSNDTAHRREYRLLQDFGAAIEAGDQLRLVYQPSIELATGRCAGVEALLRWRHLHLGEVCPAEFIPVIEQTSLARQMTQWVIDTALDQMSNWQKAGIDLVVSVNISATNLAEPDLVERIVHGLSTRSLQPDRLVIELTESAVMDQPDRAFSMLREMAAAGVGLAIDDFGTGHSSLAYLQHLPAKILKIDRAFISNLTEAAGPDYALVEMMARLAHMLGCSVVAEGVESREAAAIVAGVGCQEAQGYLFSRPLEAAQFAAWLSER